jgi:hypothetical protein
MKEAHDDGTRAGTTLAAVQPNQTTAQAIEDMTAGEKVEAVADNIAGQIVDAITGTTADDQAQASPESFPPSQSTIETEVETLTTGEIAAEEGLLPGSPDILFTSDSESILLPSSPSQANANGSSRWTSPTSPLASYEDYIRSLFSDDHKILVSQRDLTAVAMEGVAGGMAIMGLLFVLLRPR